MMIPQNRFARLSRNPQPMKKSFPSLRSARIFAVCFALALTMTSARTELIASESFEYATGNVVKQDGGSGWRGPWDGGNNEVEIESLSAAQGETPQTAGGSLLVNRPDWASTRHLAAPLGEKPGTYYISLLIRNDTGTSKENYGAVSFSSEDRKVLGFSLGQKHFGRNWGISTSNDNATADVASGNAEAVFLVAKVTYSDAPGGDSILLFANPGLASEPASPSAQVDGLDLVPVDKVKLQSRLPFSFDELRIGTTWADVCPKP